MNEGFAPFPGGTGACDIDLHIGIEKTGTTAVQAFLRVHRRELRDKHKVLFPQSLGGNLSANLAAACQFSSRLDDLRKTRGLHDRTAVDAYRERVSTELAREIEGSEPRRLVISCEHLSSRVTRPDEIQCVGDFLRPFARGVRVWVYLRRQDDFIVSAYSTAVRSGRTVDFEWPAPGRERPDLHFDRLLDRWARTFGDAAMRVRLYGTGALRGEDAVEDFRQGTGLPDLAKPEARANRALNLRQLEFLRAFNHRVPRFIDDRPNPARGDIGRAMSGIAIDGPSLRADRGAETFMQRFEAGNRAVARRWFGPESGVPDTLFDTPRSGPTDAANEAAPLTKAELVEISAGLWRHAQAKLAASEALKNTYLAELAIRDGEYERAETLLEKVLHANPKLARARYAHALLAFERGDARKARTRVAKALDLAPPEREFRALVDRLAKR